MGRFLAGAIMDAEAIPLRSRRNWTATWPGVAALSDFDDIWAATHDDGMVTKKEWMKWAKQRSERVPRRAKICLDDMKMHLGGGEKLPARKPFEAPRWDAATRTFVGAIDWSAAPLRGAARWEYRMVFSDDFAVICGGAPGT